MFIENPISHRQFPSKLCTFSRSPIGFFHPTSHMYLLRNSTSAIMAMACPYGMLVRGISL